MNYSGMEMRKAYAAVLEELGTADKDVYVLEADLSSSMSTAGLKDKLGPNYINVGIMEAHMMGVAAGLGLAGGYAFVHSFGQFVTRRAFDQLFVSLAYSKVPACIVGSDAGVTAEHNGGTHMTFEDMGLVRVIPDVQLYDVCDPVQFAAILKKARESGKLTYIRTIRKAPKTTIYPDGETFGDEGGRVLREGTDVTLVACGIEVGEALAAADLLAEEGISAEVIDMFRIKPLDSELLLRSAGKTGRVVTAENHSVINGLGSAVAETLAEHLPTPMERIGVIEHFGQVGLTDYLMEFYQLTASDIAVAARKVLKR
ncbi:transketolase family protein [Enemella sp. A6]|uniref:transketolase family protein n=1 Tax=Enemella sp. A6 TaxID=3440152 RepID=UPI003EB8BF3F